MSERMIGNKKRGTGTDKSVKPHPTSLPHVSSAGAYTARSRASTMSQGLRENVAVKPCRVERGRGKGSGEESAGE